MERQIYSEQKEIIIMENMKPMAVQLPEETYLRVKEYLKRHKMSQKDFVTGLLQRALDKDSTPGGA